MLRRQGLLEGIWCLDPAEGLGAPELTRAQLSSTVVVETELPGALMMRADFGQALMVKCNLHHAILRDAQVGQANFVACVTTGAELPPGLSSS